MIGINSSAPFSLKANPCELFLRRTRGLIFSAFDRNQKFMGSVVGIIKIGPSVAT